MVRGPNGRRKRQRNNPRKRRRRRGQRGGALARYKPRLVDKIAQGASMFLSGPAPGWGSLGLLLAKQAGKGIKDNVDLYRRH